MLAAGFRLPSAATPADAADYLKQFNRVSKRFSEWYYILRICEASTYLASVVATKQHITFTRKNYPP
jgi:hypothetical protein